LGVWVAECVHPMQRQGKAFCKVVALVIDSDRSRSEIFWSNPDARCKMQTTENVTATSRPKESSWWHHAVVST
jgi:hypothetical protein